MSKEEAMKLALDALKKLNNTNSYWWQEVDEDVIVQLSNAETALREALAEQPAPVQEMTPEMMRKVQMHSELGAYAASNLVGAYDLFQEFWRVAMSAAPQPAQQEEPVGEVSGHDWSTGILYRDLEPGAPLYTSPQSAQRKPLTGWIAVSDQIPLESDGEVLVRMRDGRCEIAWATYWHGASNAFAQWTFRDPDEDEAPTHWMQIPAIEAALGIKENT